MLSHQQFRCRVVSWSFGQQNKHCLDPILIAAESKGRYFSSEIRHDCEFVRAGKTRRGYTNLRYLLLKAQRMASLKTEFVAFQKAAY